MNTYNGVLGNSFSLIHSLISVIDCITAALVMLAVLPLAVMSLVSVTNYISHHPMFYTQKRIPYRLVSVSLTHSMQVSVNHHIRVGVCTPGDASEAACVTSLNEAL